MEVGATVQVISIDHVRGVRVAVPTFASHESGLRFVLLPLTFAGEPAYWAEVADRTASCDLVVTAFARTAWWHRLSRRAWAFALRGPRLRLALDPRPWPDVGVPTVDAAAPTEGRDPVPRERLGLRRAFLLPLALPLTVPLRYGAGRRDVAGSLWRRYGGATGTGTTRGADPRRTASERRRVELLLEALGATHDQRRCEALRVAVPFDAEVVPAISAFLREWGYSPERTDWVTVFHLTPPVSVPR